MRPPAILLFFVLLGCGSLTWFAFSPVTLRNETFVDIPPGTSTVGIARNLKMGHVIRSEYAFLLLRMCKGGSLKAGEYRFASRVSPIDVYTRIRSGDVYTRAITIPEGLNLYDIAEAVEGADLGSSVAFLQAAHSNTDLITAVSPSATSLEGYLYPDTYRFGRHTTPRAMQEAMVHRFFVEAEKLGFATSGPTIARTVIMASLVEKEVRFDDERALAAGVFENRLSRGMPLQTDPTVIYAALLASRWTGSIHRTDLDLDSPYNTYRRVGLPPGPICSPGVASLRAALHPAKTDDLYFVADRSGHTRFSINLQQHSKQVAAYWNSLR